MAKRDPVLEKGKRVERSHSQAKHNARWRMRDKDKTAQDDKRQAAWRKDYFRNVRPELDPQSTASKVLEFFGADDPYARNSGSYDYRQEQWDKSVAEGSPDPSWMLPALSDEAVTETGGAIERGLGYFNPGALVGLPPIQRPSQDERVLSRLSPEDRAALKSMHPDDADKALLEVIPGWEPKRNPFPTSWMGTREREANAPAGAMAHFIDQWNLSPYSTEDILSLFGQDAPETVRADIDAYKGGSSSLDRTMADAMGVDPETLGPKGNSPAVDAVEYGSLAAILGVPGALVRTGRAAAKGGKKAVSAGKKVVQGLWRAEGRAKPAPFTPSDAPPAWPVPPRPWQPPGVDRFANAGNGTVRSDISRAIAKNQKRAASKGAGTGALGLGLVGAGGAAMTYDAMKKKDRRK